MIVVLSLSILTFLARPRVAQLHVLELDAPGPSKTALPPVRMAMSSSMALRRSPVTRRPWTAAHLNVPRSLLMTSVASAFALDLFPRG